MPKHFLTADEFCYEIHSLVLLVIPKLESLFFDREVRCGYRNSIVVVVVVVVVVVGILLSKIVGNHCFSGKSLF